MKLKDLNFDNPNNSAISLWVMAELVRRGELRVYIEKRDEAPKLLRVDVHDLREPSP